MLKAQNEAQLKELELMQVSSDDNDLASLSQ